MRALLCAAAIMTTALASGCTAPRQSLAVADAAASPVAACGQVTGSRTGVSAERQDCSPVGYPFRQFSLEEMRLLGADPSRLVRQGY